MGPSDVGLIFAAPEGKNSSANGPQKMVDSRLKLEVSQPKSGPRSASWAHVRVVPDDKFHHASSTPTGRLHLIFVVDVSGSMGSTVESTDADGKKENHGFSILDLVKHSLLTIVNSLGEAQMVTLITFSDNVSVELRDCVMTPDGLKEATKAINALRPQCSTNLWIGLKKAYEIVKECSVKEAASIAPMSNNVKSAAISPSLFHEIMLFTDGMPNVEPPRGHIPAIQHYLQSQEIPASNHSVRTYGFGYSLDSKLLQDIAILGRGTFSFIPDAGFVGTVFIHALADMLTSVCGGVRGAKLQLAVNGGVCGGGPVNQVVGLDSHKRLGMTKTAVMCGDEKIDVVEIPLGGIALGQSRDFIIRNPDFSKVFRLVFDEWKVVGEEEGKLASAGVNSAGKMAATSGDNCAGEEPLAVTDDNLSAFNCDYDESMSMVSDFVSFNLRNRVGEQSSPAAPAVTAAQALMTWAPTVLEARDYLNCANARTVAQQRDLAKPHFCRLQMCDIISHMLDGDVNTRGNAETTRRGSFYCYSQADESGVSLEQKQKLVRDFIQKCAAAANNDYSSRRGKNSSAKIMASEEVSVKTISADDNNNNDDADKVSSVGGITGFDVLSLEDLETVLSEPQGEPVVASKNPFAGGGSSSPSPSEKGDVHSNGSNGSNGNSISDEAPSTTDRLTANLFDGCLEDLRGQITEAVSSQAFFTKWGVFYLRSLAFAHQTQRRNNFKDFGVQWYGEAEFDKQVDRINDVFDQLPPPTPSNKNCYGGRGGKAYAAPASMSVYNNCYGGCFLPECLVTIVDRDNSTVGGDRQKRCDAVRAGDVVRTGAYQKQAKVLCVIKIVGSNMLCIKFHDSQLAITPWHPMLAPTSSGKSEWVFPAEYAQTLSADATTKVRTDVVYNFVLESVDGESNTRSYADLLRSTDALKDHTMLINNVPAVTFGHGLDTNAVVRHDYWANMRAILRDLQPMSGFEDGQILLRSETACVKDPISNRVVKLVQTPVVTADEVQVSCELTDGDQPARSSRKSVSSSTVSSTSCGNFANTATRLAADHAGGQGLGNFSPLNVVGCSEEIL